MWPVVVTWGMWVCVCVTVVVAAVGAYDPDGAELNLACEAAVRASAEMHDSTDRNSRTGESSTKSIRMISRIRRIMIE